MEASARLLARLERIEVLERAGAEPNELIAELRALLEEAEAWSRLEGGEAGARSVDALRSALDSARDRRPPGRLPARPSSDGLSFRGLGVRG